MKKIKNLLKGSPVAMVVAGILIAGVASAALLTYYGVLKGKAEVWQSVLVNGQGIKTGSLEITYDIGDSPAIAGNTYTSLNTLENRADVPAKVKFETTQCVADSGWCNHPGHKEEGITTTYWKVPDTSGININGVIEEGEWDGAETIPVAGNTGTVKVIATQDYLYVLFDIEDSTDARAGQTYGNDQIGININPTDGAPWGLPCDIKFQFGADPNAWGGESSGTIDGWATQWVIDGVQQQELPSTLELNTTYTGDGRKIVECKIPLETIGPMLGDTLKIGGAIDVGDQNSYVYPTGLNWSEVNSYTALAVGKGISENTPFTIKPGETVNFAIVNEFAIDLKPDTYTIITNVVPAK